MSIAGNLSLSVVEIPLKGRTAYHLTLTDSSGTVISLDDRTVVVYLLKNADDALAAAVLTKTSAVSGEVTILSPSSSGRILVNYTSGNAALLSTQRIYTVMATVEDPTDGIVHVQTFLGVPMQVTSGQQFDGADSATNAALSTRFVNLMALSGVVGGSGYLNGVSTVSETAGVIVKFFVSSEPQEWLLFAGTTASDGVSYQRPTDYNASTNAKVWKRIA